MTTWIKKGQSLAVGAAMLGACSEVPKGATPLTDDEVALIEREMVKFDRMEPVLEEVWKRSSIGFNMERETATPEESIEVLSISASHFRELLGEGRVMAADTILQSDADPLAIMHGKNHSTDKDYIVIDRSSGESWRYPVFLHEATHSLADDSSVHSETMDAYYEQEASSEAISSLAMAERDSATLVGQFTGAFYYTEDLLFSSRLLTEFNGETWLDMCLRKTPDEYARLLLEEDEERSDIARRFEPFGVTYDELYEVYSNPEMVEYLKSIQTLYAQEWREAEEASSERRRSEGGERRR